jgi:ABC-type transport system substrate-binding protein
MRNLYKRYVPGIAILGILIPILAACGGSAEPQIIRETVPVEVTAPPVVETVLVEQTVETTGGEAGAAFTTPHPIIGNTEEGLKVRQAIAHCTNRPEVIQSVYPFLSEEEQQALLMDTFLPQGHWALTTEGITTYPFDIERGKALLEEAGWTAGEEGAIRTNATDDRLSLSFTTTNAQFRQTWSAVFIQQMAACGIEIIPTYAPGSWWFGSTTGLRRRDFELGAFAWVGQADPGGQTLYACNQIPVPDNNWNGQNYMGWCNETASNAIIAANNTLDREQRQEFYATMQQEFTKDMISLPMFNRAEAGAWSTSLQNFSFDPTDYYTHNAGEWTLDGGGDTVVLAFTQEPATMWGQIESAAVQRTAAYLISALDGTTLGYDYQPVALTELSTIESGLATNDDVTVEAGAQVWTAAGEAAELADGVEVINAEGETVAFDGSPITMKQLAVTFEYIEGLTWSDGEPVKQADFELAYKINCDPDSGGTSYLVCDSIENIEFLSDTSYTVTFLPGAQWPEYFVATIGYAGGGTGTQFYPSHLVITTPGDHEGKTLAEVPAADWSTLKEIVETPLSTGPYVLTSWEKGQRMTFEANPFYYGGEPAIKTIIIQIVTDTNQAVAQLLTGEVDVVGTETLGAGSEVQTVIDAAAQGQIAVDTIASPTWEHVDFNLYIR